MSAAQALVSGVREYQWSTERYMMAVEAGAFDGRRVELVDGWIVESMPQGDLHFFVFSALQRVFASMGGFDRGLVVQPTVKVSGGHVYDPEFAVLEASSVERFGLPTAADIALIVEVSVSSLAYDLGAKRSAYAEAGIPHYWCVDCAARGIHAFSDPKGPVYLSERFIREGEQIEILGMGGLLEVAAILPQSDLTKNS